MFWIQKLVKLRIKFVIINSKSITTQELKTLMAEYFGARLKQANLVKKADLITK